MGKESGALEVCWAGRGESWSALFIVRSGLDFQSKCSCCGGVGAMAEHGRPGERTSHAFIKRMLVLIVSRCAVGWLGRLSVVGPEVQIVPVNEG